MGNKNKQGGKQGGNYPLTHYEMTQKFSSSQYGTTQQRLAGASQYKFGDCGISLSSLASAPTVLASPSGYLYEKGAILEYLLTKTQDIKEHQAKFDKQQLDQQDAQMDQESRKRQQTFAASQQVIAKKVKTSVNQEEKEGLKRSSYWLASSQPDAQQAVVERPPERCPSPYSSQPLKRKGLWPVQLIYDDNKEKVLCTISQKPIHTQAVTAYWVDKQQPGTVVLTKVYQDIVQEDGNRCPLSSRKIKYKRALQRSGTSFAASGQQKVAKIYKPTLS